MNAREKLQKATVGLLHRDPFFASVVLSHQLEEVSDGAMDIDGKSIRYAPDFVRDKTITELQYILRHNVMHIVLGHHLRRHGYDSYEAVQRGEPEADVHKRLNVAGDLAVNSMLTGYDGAPNDVILPGQGKYISMPVTETMERYYWLLREQEKEKKDEQQQAEPNRHSGGVQQDNAAAEDTPSNIGGAGSFRQQDEQTEEDAKGVEEVRQMIARAEVVAQEAGKLPGWIKEMVQHVMAVPKLPWNVILRQFLTRSIRNKQSYSKVNRRTAWRRDAIFPGRAGRGLGHIVFGVDTSASISTASLDKALTEVQSIASAHPGAKITVIQWDASVQQIDTYERHQFPIDTSRWVWRGRGGTNVNPFLDACQRIHPVAAVCLTDGIFSWPTLVPTFPLIWLQTREFSAPFGHSILVP